MSTCRHPWALWALALPALGAHLAAQGLVADLRTVPARDNGSSIAADSIEPFRDGGSLAFFAANAPYLGYEPFVTDGTAAGTRRIGDLVPGRGDLAPALLFAHNGGALFAVRDGASGQIGFLWTDGTVAGTQPLGDLGLPTAGQFAAERLANGRILLTLGSGTFARTYATDLTAAGTVAIPGMRGFVRTAELGGLALGIANPAVGNTAFELWASDGTVAGSTRLTTDVAAGIASGSVAPPLRATATLWNGRVWFFRNRATGAELWSTDGTVAGTVAHTQVTPSQLAGYTLSAPVATANRLVFLLQDALWSSDGTAAGTGPIAGMPCGAIAQLTAFGGRAYCSAVGNGTPSGFELWSTDGTGPGTAIVGEIGPGAADGSPSHLLATPQGLWFRAANGSAPGLALWLCTGPQSLQNLGAIPGTLRGIRMPALVAFAGGVLFAPPDPALGTEPWFASPTQAPTPLGDLYQGRPGIDTTTAARGRDRLFFVADDGVHGRELWSTDGTAAGTVVVDATAGPGGSFGAAVQDLLVPFGDGMAARTRLPGAAPQSGVLVSDGTPAGTHTLPIASPVVAMATRGDDLFVFDGRRFHRSDGTAAGTVVLPVQLAQTGSAVLHVLPQALVFGGPVQRLQATDGVQAPVTLSQGYFSAVLGQVGDRVLFTDTRGLVATDGSLAGTTVLSAQVGGAVEASSDGRRMLFVTNGGLWQTDGTPAGTQRLAPLLEGYAPVVPTANGIYLRAYDLAAGIELHRYDPATGQVVLVRDLAPGTTSGVHALAAVGDGTTLLLVGTDGTDGFEPYVSDGTAAGTRRLADLVPGPVDSMPQPLGVAGASAFFVAENPVAGRELHRIDLGAVGAASLQTIAAGCPGASGRPTLAATGAPRLGDPAFGLQVARARSASLALLLLGSTLGRGAVQGCAVAPAGVVSSLVVPTSVSGTGAFALPIPNLPALLGLALTAQAFVLDGAAPAGFAASNGMFVVVGA